MGDVLTPLIVLVGSIGLPVLLFLVLTTDWFSENGVLRGWRHRSQPEPKKPESEPSFRFHPTK
jgi:hypothetical protein